MSALKELIQSGSKYAQAYGLMGLKIKQPDLIESNKPTILKSNKTIGNNSGCSWGKEKFTLILFDEKANYFERLENQLNQRYQWLKSNNKLFKPIGT